MVDSKHDPKYATLRSTRLKSHSSSACSSDQAHSSKPCLVVPMRSFLKNRGCESSHVRKKGVFMMISKPLNVRRIVSGSSQSVISIAEALRRESMQPEVVSAKSNSVLLATISSINTITSFNADDQGLDLRMIPVGILQRSRPSPRNSRKRRTRFPNTASIASDQSAHIEYKDAIARLSIQIRDLERKDLIGLQTPVLQSTSASATVDMLQRAQYRRRSSRSSNSTLLPITEERQRKTAEASVSHESTRRSRDIDQSTRDTFTDKASPTKTKNAHSETNSCSVRVTEDEHTSNLRTLQAEIEQLRHEMLMSTPTHRRQETPCPSSTEYLRRKNGRRRLSRTPSSMTSNNKDKKSAETSKASNNSLRTTLRKKRPKDATSREHDGCKVELNIRPTATRSTVSPLKVCKRLSTSSELRPTWTAPNAGFAKNCPVDLIRHPKLPPGTVLLKTMTQKDLVTVEEPIFGKAECRDCGHGASSSAATERSTSSTSSSTTNRRYGVVFESFACSPLDLRLLKEIEIDDEPIRPFLADYTFALEA